MKSNLAAHVAVLSLPSGERGSKFLDKSVTPHPALRADLSQWER
jgi:hypothetical protein